MKRLGVVAAATLAAALLSAALPACAMTEVPAAAIVQLTPASPEAEVAVRAPSGRVAIEIVRIVNPAQRAFTLVVLVSGEEEALARLAPFPADQPGRFAVRAPATAKSLRLRLEAVDGRPLPELVEARVAALSARR